MKEYKKVLSIAGSDSGGGAGIQADIKTISALGCFATTAITAITAQNTMGVTDVMKIPAYIIGEQIEAILTDIGADAVKIGMLHDSETMICVKNILIRNNVKNIILDPVMISTSGHNLMQPDAIQTLKNELLEIATIITPNIPEAEALLGTEINTIKKMHEASRKLSEKFNTSVLVKGGHMEDEKLTDILYDKMTSEISDFSFSRIITPNTHGTGCTLSSAIASYVALGENLQDAVRKACYYVHKAIESGASYKIGKGHGPVNHFF